MRRNLFRIFYLTFFLNSQIFAEKDNFFIKVSPSFVFLSNLSSADSNAVASGITPFLANYTKSSFICSMNLGCGMPIGDGFKIGMDASYIPRYPIYNKQDVSAAQAAITANSGTIAKLDSKFIQSLADSQSFVFNDNYFIFLNFGYDFYIFQDSIPFVGFKIGYVNGKIGMDPEFFDNIEKANDIAKSTNFTRNKNNEKLQIDMFKLNPIAYGSELGVSFKFKDNILLDIIYEVNKYNIENIEDNVIGATPNPTLQSQGIKSSMIMQKISLGLRILF